MTITRNALAGLCVVGWLAVGVAEPLQAQIKVAGRTDMLPLMPWPSSVTPGRGRLVLGATTRIVALDDELDALAEVIAGEIEMLHGASVPVARDRRPRGSDVELRLDDGLAAEEYRLEVDDRVRISGGTYAGVSAGTVTFLQSLTAGPDGLALPHMKIADKPHASYRGLLLDPARSFHSLDFLKKCVRLCRFYKIRHIQLHLTDSQSFTFPSRAYPKLATPGRSYTLDELRELERYAVERGVVIVPELEMPGHSGAAVRAMPELFRANPGSGSTMNFAREEVLQALDTLIGELVDVFRSTPWFHIGGDECNLNKLERDPHFKAAFKKAGVPDQHELYRHFLVRMSEIVKKHGKRMIVWEGFRRGGKVEIPRDITVMAFEGGKYYRPDHLVEDGYTIINASWQPLYIVIKRPAPVGQWPVEHIYGWNMYKFEHFRKWAPAFTPIQLPGDAPVLGAQMCSWENPPSKLLPYVRTRLPAMSERIWNPDARRDFADFRRRFQETDARLEKLLAAR